jgi:hypothetical protein
MNEPTDNCITMVMMRALIMREHARADGLTNENSAYRDSIALERVANELRELRRQRWAD